MPEPTPDLTPDLTDMDRRIRWLALHDNGISSETIANVMCGLSLDGRFGSYPADADDFGRCHRLLCLYPEWRARLNEVARISPQWAALVDRWDEIVAAYQADRRRCSALVRDISGGVARGQD